MRNEEKPARRTRRSFLKKSAMAGMGAQSALIFIGLVMTSHASGSDEPIIANEEDCVKSKRAGKDPNGGENAKNGYFCKWNESDGEQCLSVPSTCGSVINDPDENGNYTTYSPIIHCNGTEVWCQHPSSDY